MSRLVIAIDGPAASGKSSTAQWVADRLAIRHVDSGSLYRAITAAALDVQPAYERWTEADVLGQARRVRLAASGRSFAALVDGRDAGERIREPDVTRAVSAVAQMPGVRAWVNDEVRAAARDHDVVVDGRDIGTAVFPDAPLKVFLVADPWERARRRLVQQLGRAPSDREVAEETDRLVQRDAKDATQMVPARDAIVVDTTYITQEEQVDRIVALARAVTRREDVTSEG
ncbi:MAG: (d)CMP kinase [Gemmatimonadota bacterium]|nr:(d)CMP kinase [Gemmatimonadota bacterium]MDE3173739.1 (d)CMP kinase [Gemmatimonadota bacterium]